MSTHTAKSGEPTGYIADNYGFSDEEKGFSSFVNLVKLVHGVREPEAGTGWDRYLLCSLVMQGGGWKPLPRGFPVGILPQLLPKETAESVDRRCAALNGLRQQIEDSIAASGEPDAGLLNEVGPKALAAIRGLADDLEVQRFDSGELYVLGLKMRQAIPPERAGNAKLIQIFDKVEKLREQEGVGELLVRAVRLIYRLPADCGNRTITPAQWDELDRIHEQIEKEFVELFPGTHAVIELRDCDGATLLAGRVVGPTYDEEKQELDRMKAKTKHL